MEQRSDAGASEPSLSAPYRLRAALGADEVRRLVVAVVAEEWAGTDPSGSGSGAVPEVVLAPAGSDGWLIHLSGAHDSERLTAFLHGRVVPRLLGLAGAESLPPAAESLPPAAASPPQVAESPTVVMPPPVAGPTDGAPPVTDSASVPRAEPEDPIDRKLSDYLDDGRVAFNPPSAMKVGDQERFSVRVIRSVALDDRLVADLDRPGEVLVDWIRAGYRMKVTASSTDGLELRALSEPVQLVATNQPTEWQFIVDATEAGAEMVWVSAAALLPNPEAPDEIGSVISLPVLHHAVSVSVTTGEKISRFLRGNWQWVAGTVLTVIGLGFTAIQVFG